MRMRNFWAALMFSLVLAASALPAGDSNIASIPGGKIVKGTEFCGAGQLRFEVNGNKLTLTVTQNQVTIYYADGTSLATLKLNDSVEISGDLLSKGIGGKIDGRGFTLVPGLRFTVKNMGSTTISIFDTVANKMVDVRTGAVVILEVRIDQFNNSDDLGRSLRQGHLVKVGKNAVVARIETGVIVMAYENLNLGKSPSQVNIGSDSSIIVEVGRLSLREGVLDLSGSQITVVTLHGNVTVTTASGKIDLTAGMTSTSGPNGFGRASLSSNLPTGFVFLATGGSTSGTTGTNTRSTGSKKGFVLLVVPTYNPNSVPGEFGTIIIIGGDRTQLSGTH
ncbi:MAG TPA: hypothetical protein VL860_00995 [Planctomycetota bacterium]|nr:hypothetical protein [Planctomycetota bacterium]